MVGLLAWLGRCRMNVKRKETYETKDATSEATSGEMNHALLEPCIQPQRADPGIRFGMFKFARV